MVLFTCGWAITAAADYPDGGHIHQRLGRPRHRLVQAIR
jgi:hypothetical protein